jgi:O-antigen ligase
MGRFDFWSLICLFGIFFILPKLPTIKFSVMDGLVFAFYALNVVSILWSRNFGEAIFTSQKYLLFFISYLLIRYILVGKEDYLAFLSKLLLIVSLFTCIITSYQLIDFFLYKRDIPKAIYKIVGYSGHKNLAASFLFLLFCFHVYYAALKKQRLWYFFFLGIQLLILLLLKSRSIYLALICFSAISLFSYFYTNKTKYASLLKKAVPFALLLFLMAAGVLSYLGKGKNYVDALNPLTYKGSSSGTERLFVWYKTFELIKEAPMQGQGSGNWKVEFPRNNISGGYRLQEKDILFTRVHNDFLEVWSEVGILGLLLYLGMFIYAIWLLGRRIRKKGFEKGELILIATLLSYMIIAFFSFPKERIEHQVVLALFLAIIVSKSAIYEYSWQLGAMQRKMGMALLGSLLLVNIPLAYYRTKAELCSEQIIINLKKEDLKSLRENAQKGHSIWSSLNTITMPFKFYEGLSYYNEAQYEKAATPFKLAYELNPYNFNVLNNYGSTLVKIQKYEQAIPLYLKALEINPKFEEGMFNLSYAYYQIKEYQRALEWVEKVKNNAPKKEVFLKEIRTAMAAEKG